MMEVQPIRDRKIIDKIKELMSTDGKSKELLLFTIGINSALRISDILRLKWGDLKGDTIKIKEKKTGKWKEFPITPSVRKVLDEEFYNWRENRDDEFIFTSESNRNHGNVWSRQYVWLFLNEYAKKAGWSEPVGTHTMRKTWGYHAHQAGYPLELIQKALNHSSPAITLRYIGITDNRFLALIWPFLCRNNEIN